jgi:predicted site-specific integrase-resolvase
MGRLIGYARVSTADQDLSSQLEALRHAGCRDEQIFCETVSGTRAARPSLEACLQALAPGDTLVVWRLDRLGRSMTHLVIVIEALLRQQVGFRSLCDGALDTTTASGELVFHIFSALAQFERRLIQERTRAGPAAAERAGRRGAASLCSLRTPACGWRPGCMATHSSPWQTSATPYASRQQPSTATLPWGNVLLTAGKTTEEGLSTGVMLCAGHHTEKALWLVMNCLPSLGIPHVMRLTSSWLYSAVASRNF